MNLRESSPTRSAGEVISEINLLAATQSIAFRAQTDYVIVVTRGKDDDLAEEGKIRCGHTSAA